MNPSEGRSLTLRLAHGAKQVQVTWLGNAFVIEGKPALKLSDIVEVNLSMSLGGEDDVTHYLCRIWPVSGPILSLRANADDPADCAAYLEWIAMLHQTLHAQGVQPKYSSGMRSQVGYYLLMGLFAVLFAGIGGAIIFAMATKGKVLFGILMLAATLGLGALFFWLMRSFAKPRGYDPSNIPSTLLPRLAP
ncbi:MAG: hypothetical protein U0176_13275 [Bacteroidia bacterium]